MSEADGVERRATSARVSRRAEAAGSGTIVTLSAHPQRPFGAWPGSDPGHGRWGHRPGPSPRSPVRPPRPIGEPCLDLVVERAADVDQRLRRFARPLEQRPVGAQACELQVGQPRLARAEQLAFAADLEILLGELEPVRRLRRAPPAAPSRRPSAPSRAGDEQRQSDAPRRARRGRAAVSARLPPAEELTDAAKERLEALVQTTDGFELAEKDLEIRGEGHLLGTRQSGLSDLKLAPGSPRRPAVARGGP